MLVVLARELVTEIRKVSSSSAYAMSEDCARPSVRSVISTAFRRSRAQSIAVFMSISEDYSCAVTGFS